MEWTVVTALIALVGLGASIIKPIVSLTRSITTLTVVVERVEKELASQARHSQESHRRIWAKNEGKRQFKQRLVREECLCQTIRV